jgi:hypothetical protein
VIRRLVLAALLVAVGGALGYLWRDTRGPIGLGDAIPFVRESDPRPGSPPVAWLAGRIREVTGDRILLQEGSGGPTIQLRRFAAGATRVHRLVGTEWREVPRRGLDRAQGTAACVEALMDEGELLAVRVFLRSTCAPIP